MKLGIGLGLGLTYARGGGFSTLALFAGGEQGAWYDPSDLTTLFQDSSGATPVTAAGQPVGLVLDKSQGLTLGSELTTNGGFDDGATGWGVSGEDATHIATFADGKLRYQSDTTSPQLTVTQSAVMIIGKTYLVEVVTSAWVSGSIKTDQFGSIVLSSGVGTKTFRGVATATSFSLTRNSANVDLTIDSISVKLLPGNHATQATAAARPTYGVVPKTGRRNLFEQTESFGDTYWTKERLTAVGTSLVPTAVSGTHNLIRIYPKSGIPTSYTVSGRGTADGYNFLLLRIDGGASNGVKVGFNIATGEISNAAATNGTGWTILGATITPSVDGGYAFSLSFTTDTTITPRSIAIVSNIAGDAFAPPSYAGDGSSGIILEGYQLETGSTATAYQKVTTQFDVTEAGVPSLGYLFFDGVDDFLVTPTITPGTDKVQVFTGVRKLSDAAVGMVVEHSDNAANNAGAFYVTAPEDATNRYASYSRGASVVGTGGRANITGVGAAPDSAVLTATHDILGDLSTISRNGVAGSNGTVDKGAGNFLAYPMYIGRRGGTSLPFNGHLYSLITRFGPNLDATAINKAETYIAGKTGVTL